MNVELREAIEKLNEYSDSDIFIIPVRLDDCNPNLTRLEEIQWVDMFPHWENGFKKIVQIINYKKIGKS